MGPEQRKTRKHDEPTSTRDEQQRDEAGTLEQAGRGVVNLFTIERDTSLAEGAGAPGSTSVGGMRRQEDGRDEPAGSAADRRDRRDESE